MGTEFRISENITIFARSEKTRNGFRHIAEYYRNGGLVESRSVSYLNRTWESYEYETAISMLLDKMIKNKQINPQDKPKIMAITSGKAKADLDSRFGTISAIAQMGEIFGQTKKESNDWKARMIKAGLGSGISMPEDWDTLSEYEKEKRLNKVIAELNR
jgi:hypothetical protein